MGNVYLRQSLLLIRALMFSKLMLDLGHLALVRIPLHRRCLVRNVDVSNPAIYSKIRTPYSSVLPKPMIICRFYGTL
jgi:hypothetical protein